MPGSGDDAHRVEGHHPRILKFSLNLGERLHGVGRQVYAGEAQVISVLHHVGERDDAGPALRSVEPVAGPRISADVGLALIPDVYAVEAVVKDRNPDEEQLQKKDERQAVQKLDLFSVGDGAFEGFGIRDEMFEKKGSDGYDAAERMQTAQQERGSLAGAQWSDTRFDMGSDRIGSCCHDKCSLSCQMLKPAIIVFRGKGSQGEIEPLTAEIAESAEKNLAVSAT